MCTTCGCGDPEIVPVELHEKILAGNDRTAAHNRAHLAELGVLALNLMGSPGSGKTAVLEATARGAAAKGWRLAAVSADLATDHDARRLEKAGIPSRAITTGQACHLDAELVHRAMHGFPLDGADVFFIENVGNLVCPAIYDLGQRANVVVLSITEGEDKPLKYPVMFKAADLVLLTKCDLAPHLDVDLARIHDAVARVMPRPRVIEVSARTGAGLDAWIAWLEDLRAGAGARPERAHPHVHDHHGHRHEEGAHAGDDAHAHGHEHEHEHRHGGVAHAHPHAHVHVHPHGGADASAARGTDHAHAGSAGHDHPHDEAPAAARGRRTAARKVKATRRPPARVPAGKVARGPARKRAAARTGRPGTARRRRGR